MTGINTIRIKYSGQKIKSPMNALYYGIVNNGLGTYNPILVVFKLISALVK